MTAQMNLTARKTRVQGSEAGTAIQASGERQTDKQKAIWPFPQTASRLSTAVGARGRSFRDTSHRFLIRPRANFPGIRPPLSAAGNSRQERGRVGRKEDVGLPPGAHVQPRPGSLTRSSLALIRQRQQPSTPFSPTGSLPVPPPFLGEQRIRAPAEVSQGALPTSRTC